MIVAQLTKSFRKWWNSPVSSAGGLSRSDEETAAVAFEAGLSAGRRLGLGSAMEAVIESRQDIKTEVREVQQQLRDETRVNG